MTAEVKRETGHYREQLADGEAYTCYIPKKLPPDPPVQIEKFYSLLDKAGVALGALNGIRINLPDASLFLSVFAKKEAVLSSQIEGTQSSLSDLLLFESEKKAARGDETEIANYISAMNYGMEKIHSLPLSRRLLCEIHEKLLSGGSGVRGSEKQPGQVRTSQNWIGGTRPGNAVFVPPPPDAVADCLSDLEKFLHDESAPLPVLIKAALVHVQFETIHPFLDGNGRLGRLLIIFMLCLSGLLKEPLLYLSLFFKTHKKEYYRLLQSVREDGDFEAWIEFFLTAVQETAERVFQTSQDIVSLFEKDGKRIKSMKKDTAGVLKTYEFLKKQPVSDTKKIVQETSASIRTVLRSLKTLEEINIAKEITGRYHNKIFIYKDYIDILDEGTV